MLFHVPHHIFELFAMRADNHVDMAAHDTPAIYFQSFLQLAMFPAFNHDIPVFIADKQIYPIYNSEGDKIKLVLVIKFVLTAHGSLKVPFC